MASTNRAPAAFAIHINDPEFHDAFQSRVQCPGYGKAHQVIPSRMLKNPDKLLLTTNNPQCTICFDYRETKNTKQREKRRKAGNSLAELNAENRRAKPFFNREKPKY